jgi:hypothetical protein
MAREGHDRENLLAEAKALVERASVALPGCVEEVLVGFRRDGGASFYFGAEPVYQFTSVGHLRRAFVGGLLYKAERGRLVSLTRRRTSVAVELVHQQLSASAQRAFLANLRRHLDALRDALAGGDFHLVGQVPEGADVIGRVRAWLEQRAGPIDIAGSPRAG